MLKLNTKYVEKFVSNDEFEMNEPIVQAIDKLINDKSGLGSDFLGWTNLANDFNKVELANIKSASKKIISDSNVLLIIGIGGSYLGAKAVIDFLSDSFYNLKANNNKLPEIYFAGHNMSSTYMKDLEEVIADRDFSINIISKSGTTTEPAIAFRHFKNILVQKYGIKEANSRIYATTDANKGALKEQSVFNDWTSFVVPDDIGGRFSVLTAVGLLPIACAGINIDQLLKGAQKAIKELRITNLKDNDCYKYAVIRNSLYKQGKDIEILVGYEPALAYFNEWWKQLFGESEGKNSRGIFPTSVIYSTDLHSMGQMIQSGKRNIFETVINIKTPRHQIEIKKEENDGDGLNYLASKTVDYVNKKAFEATAIAHSDGGVPNIILELEDMSEVSIGYMIYFFERACALSGYMLGINPFDQPGVEEYKKNMFALLGKEGFEELRNKLIKQ